MKRKWSVPSTLSRPNPGTSDLDAFSTVLGQYSIEYGISCTQPPDAQEIFDLLRPTMTVERDLPLT